MIDLKFSIFFKEGHSFRFPVCWIPLNSPEKDRPPTPNNTPLISLSHLGLQNAMLGVRKMLNLIWSGEASIKVSIRSYKSQDSKTRSSRNYNLIQAKKKA